MRSSDESRSWVWTADEPRRRGADNDPSKDIVEMKSEEAYRLVLHQVVRWLERNVDPPFFYTLFL